MPLSNPSRKKMPCCCSHGVWEALEAVLGRQASVGLRASADAKRSGQVRGGDFAAAGVQNGLVARSFGVRSPGASGSLAQPVHACLHSP